MRSNSHLAVIACLTGLMVSLVYWPGLEGGFFFDDIHNIVESPALHVSALDYDVLLTAAASGHAGPLGRPVSLLTFALDFYRCGLGPYCYKLINLGIHVFNSLLVVGLIILIAREVDIAGKVPKSFVLLILTLLWALHPIQLTSVLYVVQRMTSLSSLFVLIALLLHIYARSYCTPRLKLLFFLLAWVVFFPLGLFSKETGLLFLGYVFCYESIIRPNCQRGFDLFGRIYLFLSGIALGVIVLSVLFWPSWLVDGYVTRPFTLSERLITETRVLWQYAQMIFFPSLWDFSLHHDDVVLSTSIFSPRSGLISTVGWIFVLVFVWRQRKKSPLFSFALSWFVVGHSAESTIIPIEIMHEHRNYLPSLVLPFLGLYLYSLMPISLRVRNLAVIFGGGALVFYLAVLTYLRSDMYGNEFRRTQIEVQYNPMSARSNYDAGAALLNIYHIQKTPMYASMARGFFTSASAIDKNFKLGLLAQLQIDCLENNSSSEMYVAELSRRLSVGNVGVQERSAMSGIAAAAAAKTLCLSRDDLTLLFDSFLKNPRANGYDKSKVLNVYGYYLWTQDKNATGALDAFNLAIHYNDGDIANYFNKIELLRWFGDRDGIIEIVGYIQDRPMVREERLRWNALRENLVKDGVLN